MALRNRKTRVQVPAEIVTTKLAKGAHDCPLTRCMDLLKGAWATQVIWYLSAEPRRFGELRRDIPAVSARVLSQRLRELESKGVVTRTVAATTPPSTEYALTSLGRILFPVVAAIAEVGQKLGASRARR